MKILLIEDEAFAADALERMILKLRPETRVLAKLESVEESVEWLEHQNAPDLIFCDIHLSDGNSFRIFNQIRIESPVIFTTAYDKYAIEAFRVNSIDYLLKPIEEEKLAAAISKFEHLNKSNISEGLKNIQDLLGTFSERNDFKTRFMVKSGNTIKSIPSDEVAYFLAEEGAVLLVTFTGSRFVINYTLDQLDQQLDQKIFFRANRQLIVNIRSVREVNPYFKGRLHLMLDPKPEGEQIISSNKASAFKDWLDI